MKFSDIKNRIRVYTDNDAAMLVDEWVRDGQSYLEDKIKNRAMEAVLKNQSLAKDVNSIAVPADYLELMYLCVIDGNIRIPMHDRLQIQEFISRFTNVGTTNTGRPEFFMRQGDNFVFERYTDKAYKYEIGYYKKLLASGSAVLTNDDDTNWWTDNDPNALIYAGLVEGIPFLRLNDKKDKARIEVWIAKRDEAVKRLERKYNRERYSGVSFEHQSVNVF